MDGCSVLGCKNNFRKGGKNFYRFPVSANIKNQWMEFTKRKGLEPKDSFICEDHFEPHCLENRQGIICLAKNAIPTINGCVISEVISETDIETVQLLSTDPEPQIEQDEIVEQYTEEEDNPIKCCCRFCGEIKEVNFPIKNLDLFGVDLESFMKFMDLNTEFNEYLSEIVCEECFNQITPLARLKDQYKRAEIKMLQELGLVEEEQVEATEEICEEYLDNDLELQEATDIVDSFMNNSSKPNNSTSLHTNVEFINTNTKNVKNESSEPTEPPQAKKPKTTRTIKRTLEFECNLCNNIFQDTIQYKNHECLDENQQAITGKERVLRCIERVEEVNEHHQTYHKTARRKQISIKSQQFQNTG